MKKILFILFLFLSTNCFAEVNKKYSYGSWMGKDLSKVEAKEFNNSEIWGSCFYQENEPDKHIFPEDMTGVTFYKCNLDNVYIPAGNTVDSSCTHKKIRVQNDWEDWILDKDLKPVKAMSHEQRLEVGFSTSPANIPIEKLTPEQAEIYLDGIYDCEELEKK
jgi:hypothetical protein